MESRPGVRVAIGMGSNLGKRLTNLRVGLRAVRKVIDGVHVSSVYETVPLHVADQPSFLNACCVGHTSLTPRRVLSELQHIEDLSGRVREGVRYGPRTLDLDLLLYGERSVCEADLVIPHPQLRERAFALVPLREIAADWRVPGDDVTPERSVSDLAEAVGSEGVLRTDLRLEDD